MTYADDFWLGTTAMQRNVQHAWSYGAAFYGTAALQTWKLSMEAPIVFWQAVNRSTQSDVSAMPKAAAPAAAAPTVAVVPDPVEPVVSDPAPEDDVVLNPHLLDAPRGGTADDLTSLSGVADKLQMSLYDLGVYHFDQLAGLDAEGVAWINEQLPGFKALVSRFDIVGQAKAVAA